MVLVRPKPNVRKEQNKNKNEIEKKYIFPHFTYESLLYWHKGRGHWLKENVEYYNFEKWNLNRITDLYGLRGIIVSGLQKCTRSLHFEGNGLSLLSNQYQYRQLKRE